MEPTPPQVNIEHVDGSSTVTTSSSANDTITVRIVICSIAGVILAALLVICVLVLSGQTLPDGLVIGLLSLPTAGLGALAAMLVSTSSRRT